METNTIISIIFILVGAAFLFASIITTLKIKENVPDEVKKRWLISSALMIFFFVGYIFAVIILAFKIQIPLEIITGIIFFGGGLFVNIIINMSKVTIRTIEEKEVDLWLSKENLRKKIEERQSITKIVDKDDLDL